MRFSRLRDSPLCGEGGGQPGMGSPSPRDPDRLVVAALVSDQKEKPEESGRNLVLLDQREALALFGLKV